MALAMGPMVLFGVLVMIKVWVSGLFGVQTLIGEIYRHFLNISTRPGVPDFVLPFLDPAFALVFENNTFYRPLSLELSAHCASRNSHWTFQAPWPTLDFIRNYRSTLCWKVLKCSVRPRLSFRGSNWPALRFSLSSNVSNPWPAKLILKYGGVQTLLCSLEANRIPILCSQTNSREGLRSR